jgi:hypothetical protein
MYIVASWRVIFVAPSLRAQDRSGYLLYLGGVTALSLLDQDRMPRLLVNNISPRGVLRICVAPAVVRLIPLTKPWEIRYGLGPSEVSTQCLYACG